MIVAYYTRGTPYEAEAYRLRRSLVRLGLDHEIVAVDDRGSWRANTLHKPFFLRSALERHARPILYLDADAYVHADPWPLLRSLSCDVAMHRWRRREWLTGTILLNPTPATLQLLDQWSEAAKTAVAPDQNVLNAILGDDVDVTDLPVEYAFICDLARDDHPTLSPVIEHLQASRAFRDPERPASRLPGRVARLAELGAA